MYKEWFLRLCLGSHIFQYCNNNFDPQLRRIYAFNFKFVIEIYVPEMKYA